MAVTKQKGHTKVEPRPKKSVAKVGSGTKRSVPKVPHTSSHLNPKTPKRGGNKAGMVMVKQGVTVVEYPGERSRKGGFKGVKSVDSRG
jgi:hypothetical protein